jgi:hypothetical protein
MNNLYFINNTKNYINPIIISFNICNKYIDISNYNASIPIDFIINNTTNNLEKTTLIIKYINNGLFKNKTIDIDNHIIYYMHNIFFKFKSKLHEENKLVLTELL